MVESAVSNLLLLSTGRSGSAWAWDISSSRLEAMITGDAAGAALPPAQR